MLAEMVERQRGLSDVLFFVGSLVFALALVLMYVTTRDPNKVSAKFQALLIPLGLLLDSLALLVL